jgi:hypothetical protein
MAREEPVRLERTLRKQESADVRKFRRVLNGVSSFPVTFSLQEGANCLTVTGHMTDSITVAMCNFVLSLRVLHPLSRQPNGTDIPVSSTRMWYPIVG